jgi:protein SCO1/2
MLMKSALAAPLASTILAREPHVRGSESVRGPRADYFPNFVLRTQDNKPVRFYDDLVQGKIVVFNFFYATCEGACPAATANLLKVQRLLGDRVGRDYHMYSITLNSNDDTPKVLKDYAAMHGAKPGWLFLTGKPEEIEILRHKLGYVDPDPVKDKDKSRHIGLVRYGNEAMDRWAACPVLMNPERIAEAIHWMDFPETWPGRK